MKTLLLVITLMSTLHVQSVHALDEEFIYSLGGGAVISRGATNRYNTHKISAGVSWNGNPFCGDFDIVETVKQQLEDDVENFFNNLMGSIVDYVAGYIGGLAALELQRFNPALYDLFQNGSLQASAEYNISKDNCEAVFRR